MNSRPLFALLPLCLLAFAGCTASRQTAESCCTASSPIVKETSLQVTTLSASAVAIAGDDLFATPFLSPDTRTVLALDHRVTTHDGTVTTLRNLVDRPTAISFAYSRCSNPNKCPRVVHAMGALRHDLERAGLLGGVRLLVISYDPGYDTPAVMRSFAKLNELPLDTQALFLRPEPDPEHMLFRDLGVRASFNEGGVSIHGIQLLLLDKQGRCARAYRTVLWDNQQVLADLERLVHAE